MLNVGTFEVMADSTKVATLCKVRTKFLNVLCDVLKCEDVYGCGGKAPRNLNLIF